MSSLKKKWALEVDRMLTPNIMPKLSVGRIGRETSDKITRSFAECEENDLSLRQVLCPHCKSIVAEVFSDCSVTIDVRPR